MWKKSLPFNSFNYLLLQFLSSSFAEVCPSFAIFGCFFFSIWLYFEFALMWFLCYLFHCYRGVPSIQCSNILLFPDNKKAVYLSVHWLFQHPNRWFIPVFSSWMKLIISQGDWGLQYLIRQPEPEGWVDTHFVWDTSIYSCISMS